MHLFLYFFLQIMDRNVLILFGSQTGTAQDVAERIGRESKRYHFQAKVQAMDDYCDDFASLLDAKIVIFVAATTGQGDQPDNMVKFWRALLKRSLPKNCLQGLKYSVLGLGDSGYAQFNYAAKRLNRRLGQLGACSILNIGLADDQHDLGQDFVIEPWIRNLMNILLDLMPLPSELKPISKDFLAPAKFKIDHDLEQCLETFDSEDCYLLAPISKNQRMTSEDHFQDTRLIEFECKSLQFRPGDVCLVQPRNSAKNVQTFLDLFGHFDPDKAFKLVKNDENVQWPTKCILSQNVTTLRYVF